MPRAPRLEQRHRRAGEPPEPSAASAGRGASATSSGRPPCRAAARVEQPDPDDIVPRRRVHARGLGQGVRGPFGDDQRLGAGEQRARHVVGGGPLPRREEAGRASTSARGAADANARASSWRPRATNSSATIHGSGRSRRASARSVASSFAAIAATRRPRTPRASPFERVRPRDRGRWGRRREGAAPGPPGCGAQGAAPRGPGRSAHPHRVSAPPSPSAGRRSRARAPGGGSGVGSRDPRCAPYEGAPPPPGGLTQTCGARGGPCRGIGRAPHPRPSPRAPRPGLASRPPDRSRSGAPPSLPVVVPKVE